MWHVSRDGICPIEASQLSPRWWVVCLFKTRIYAKRYQPLLKLESWYKQSDSCHITSAISLVSLCPIPFDNWGRNISLLLWFVLLPSDIAILYLTVWLHISIIILHDKSIKDDKKWSSIWDDIIHCIIYNMIRTGMPSGPFSWCPHTAGGVKVCFHIMTPCEESMIQHLDFCIVIKNEK